MYKKISRAKEEAEANIRRIKSGQYCNLIRYSLVRKGKKHLTDKQMMALFGKLRMRTTLTPQCNIWCLFCSNEGLSYDTKTYNHADIDLVIKLSEMLLKNTPLKAIDFSGGEPTIHPDFIKKEFRLVKWTRKFPNVRFSLHTNGINLIPEFIDQLKGNFSRIGISVHSFDFRTWSKVTNLNAIFSLNTQKQKFEKLLNNLDYLSKQNIGYKIFLKSVIMRGINDSEKELKSFLEACNKYQFHPKFLEFEPQYVEQKRYVVKRKEFLSKLEKIGCKFDSKVPQGDNSNEYIPAITFTYKDTPMGLHGIFGCGTKAACDVCYDYLCMFIKPYENGKGLYLKPCSVLDTRIDLTYALSNNNFRQIFDLFKFSREYLMLRPGLGVSSWRKDY